ncbi:chemotaxis protein CheD [Stutzerimonas azotifigens]|uniref:Probable chemoreceptor glutamine deamidase CheD n=1 Tax=Stutzerimonas azotifigens TaxID=291995 RepID=A0ABR5Z565_9GAMM|nr:chemotaxis protein CheD [Stutzerimonas azotifigens]MBA1275335.1 chemotaxis protein CheD [Stutzerimonas azotifigens]
MPKPSGVIEIFLQPGELYFGDRSTRIRTLLGSCVSLVLWHPEKELGGMSHFMLPTRRQECSKGLDGRYGDEAIALLLEEIKRSKTRPQDYSLRLFGGGNMFPSLGRDSDRHIGERNIQAARSLIRDHGLQCHGEDVGGTGHRNLIFDIWSGRVAIKRSQPASGSSRV